MGDGGYMQCGVAGVDVMTNRDEEVRSWILATRSDPKGTRDQGGRLIEHSRGPAVVTRGDRGEEREQRIIEVMGSPTWLHHRYRLSNLGPGCSGQVSYHVDRREANVGAAQGSGMPDTEQLAVMPCPDMTNCAPSRRMGAHPYGKWRRWPQRERRAGGRVSPSVRLPFWRNTKACGGSPNRESAPPCARRCRPQWPPRLRPLRSPADTAGIRR